MKRGSLRLGRTPAFRGLAAVTLSLVASPLLGQQATTQPANEGSGDRSKQTTTQPASNDRVNPESQISDAVERIGENHVMRIGHVEFVQGDSTLFADQVEIFEDQNRAIATGNVVLSQGNNRIASERADFNTQTMLGTFYHAWGLATLRPPKQQVRPGFNAPTQFGVETDVYFYGDEVDKVGPKKYRITNGGFTTCVQPTPRWHLTSSTTILNLDHYTVLHQAVFNVKGVPMLYIPFLYYPTKKDERTTGFLLPTYGASTIHGQTLNNAFFWAINRSQDTTIMYDYFGNHGQGVANEYRYNLGGGSAGNIAWQWIDQKETTISGSDGTSSTLPASTSYQIRGTASEILPGNFRAVGRVDYFSDLTAMQTTNSNIYDATRTRRSYGGNIVGVTNGISVNATFDHSEYFYADTSALSGSWPRVTLARNERPLFGSDLYFYMSGEYADLLRVNKSSTGEVNTGLNRFDLNPQIRYPFKQWQWFTVNTTISWRETYYTRSQDPASQQVIDQGLNRQYWDFKAQMIGPLFAKIWDTDRKTIEKFKHSIEPFVNLERTSAIDNFDKIVQLDSGDAVVGNATSYTYGVNNRFYAKHRPDPATPNRAGQATEILNIELSQSYYTDARSAQYDQQYSTSFTGVSPSNFSPIALAVRTLPNNQINATMRAEFDSRYHALRTISAGGTYQEPGWLSVSITWSKRGYIPELPGFNVPSQLDHYIGTQANVHTRDNRYGGIYSLNYDILNSTVLQQRLTGFYNAQCCGVSFEYQTYNLAGTSLAITQDRRFFMSFTLAGLGNFSPFSGAMSGVPR